MLSPRLVPVLYADGLATLLLWAVTICLPASGELRQRAVGPPRDRGLRRLRPRGLRIACEALLVFFKANEVAADSVSRTRISSTLLDEVRDAIHDMADEEDDFEDDET